MKKASDILLLIGAILLFISAGMMLLTCVASFIFSSIGFRQLLIDGIENGTIQSDFSGTSEEIAIQIQGLFTVFAFVSIASIIPLIVSGIFSLVARNKKTTGFYITCLILSIIFGGNIFSLIGSILGLVDTSENNEEISIKKVEE